MNAQNIAIVGATGAVGVEILRVLERRNFPVASLKLLASARSAGKTLEFKGKPYKVEELKADVLQGRRHRLLLAGATRSREFVPAAKAAGAVVIDNSSAFRMDPNVPLVVPEVNARRPAQATTASIANPNCTAAILAAAVWPIHHAAGIRKHRRVDLPVGVGRGRRGDAGARGPGARLRRRQGDHAHGVPAPDRLQRLLAQHQGGRERLQRGREQGGRRDAQDVPHAAISPIVPTCIRVPVLRAHSEAITLELEAPLSPEEARAILASAPGVKMVDDPAANHFPMPLEASGDLDVHVGRIRRDLSNPNGLVLFVAGDQLLKGAAWNAVQIAEELAKPRAMAAE